ncbi:MAG: GAF domain-containing protein [Proteobacteria bacterium]|nr:GAF domain-containing protein [Pseudomonadota bacterium]
MSDDSPSNKSRSTERQSPGTLEREAFVRTFLRRGVEFTADFVREYQALKDQNARLRQDNAELRAQMASDDVLRDLAARLEGIEQERQRLVARSRQLEQSNREHEGRHAQVERELDDMANLYVASFQLHSSLTVPRVVQHLCELLEQFIGAKGYVLYLLDREGRQARPVHARGLAIAQIQAEVLGDGAIGEACITGLAWMVDQPARGGSPSSPLAIIPLGLEGKTIGALTVFQLLQQKQRWAPIDKELFELLAAHFSTALVAANLYRRVAGPLDALDGIAEVLAAARQTRENA